MPTRATNDSPMEVPGFGRALRLLGRMLLLRCPNCGGAPVLKGFATVHERCASCGFKFERTPNFFQGAMFFHYLVGAGCFLLGLGAFLVLSWPDVPWDALTWGAPLALVAFMLLFYPLSKVIWLTVDVFMRPVTQAEL
ncbi:MAG: putative rane protein [Gemmatimonadetes bacterium]|nr:putative rane protein [Gemmatimonadota bacterium]